jgi:hypothetical protein
MAALVTGSSAAPHGFEPRSLGRISDNYGHELLCPGVHSFCTLESRSAAVAAMTFAKGADLYPISAAV